MAKGKKMTTEAPKHCWIKNKQKKKKKKKWWRKTKTKPWARTKAVLHFHMPKNLIRKEIVTNIQIVMNCEEIHKNLRKGCLWFYKP